MEEDLIDLRTLFETLRRQTLLIAATIGLCIGMAALYLFSVTPLYTASALVLIDPSQKNLLDPGMDGNLNQGFANSRIDSEVEILRSDAVALSVVKNEGLISDPEFRSEIGLWQKVQMLLGIQNSQSADPQAVVRDVTTRFKEATEIRRMGQTFLISVSASSAAPNRAAELANAHANSYIAQQVEAKIRSSLASRDILQRQIVAARDDLARSEDALDSFIAQNLARIEAETGRGEVIELGEALNNLESGRLQSEVILRQSLEAVDSRNWSALAAELESQVLSDLERERTGIERRLGRVVEGSQEAIDLRAEVSALEAKLEAEAKKELGSIRQNISGLAMREQETRQQLRETLFSGQLPADLLANIFEIQQDAANARSQYQNLLERTRDIETQAGVQIADSRIVSDALPPTSPSFPNSKLIIAVALVLGSGLGILLALLREYFIGGFASAEQLEAALNGPVATIVPLIGNLEKDETSPADKVVYAPLSAYAEAMRRLRASVDHTLRSKGSVTESAANGVPVVLVASTVPNEGKTTTALGLARTYALAGKKALLIDADLRKPSLHAFVKAEPSNGFLDYLRTPEAEVPMKNLFKKDVLSSLLLILGRSRSDIPTDQLLSSTRFEEVLEAARNHFDIVILDSPPLLQVVDGLYLAKYADLTILVVKWASTSQSELRSVRGPLREAMRSEARIVGVLSQKIQSRRGYNSDYYSYDNDSA